jgi:hypothetical protein
VLDLIGGGALEDAPKQVKDVSRIASIIDPQTVLNLGGRYVFVRPEREHLDALRRLVDDGKLRVHIAETFPRPDRRRPPGVRGGSHARQDRRHALSQSPNARALRSTSVGHSMAAASALSETCLTSRTGTPNAWHA